MRTLWTFALAVVVCVGPLGAAETPAVFHPDPLSVQRSGKGYRYPQAGWIVLHIEGEPYQRGDQHGRLMASEIAAYVHCCASLHNSKAPEEGWKLTRTLVNALFLRRFEAEYLEEMKGIADGAAAVGAKYDGRAIDLTDIVALNCWAEIESLDDALEAWPTGLEGKLFPHGAAKRSPVPTEGHCSAFAATGPATADGKIVFGHITMWNLYASRHFNVWLDVQPAKGHRVLMQSFPGGIQSGMDYYMNSAGLLVSETTIAQTRFDIEGLALAGRIRKALQYADSIDAAVEALKASNNGLYTNEWLLADVKTNEIAMFELGTHTNRLYRSSKGEWYGGTEGFYWGCNNTKDLAVRMESIPSVQGRPANMVWQPSDRDKTWQRLYAENKGKIDADFGRKAFTTPPLAAIHSLDAKYTTSAMAQRLETWAIFGPPMGKTWEPTQEERKKFSDIRPIVSNPWTILRSPMPAPASTVVAADIHDRVQSEPSDDDDDPATSPAWHGTILPKSNADMWLAVGFAEYEKIAALESDLRGQNHGTLTTADQDRLALALNEWRSRYLTATRAAGDLPLSRIRPGTDDEQVRVAAGKGVLILHELQQKLGIEQFCTVMDKFGRANAGKEVTTVAFIEHVAKQSGQKLDDFFAYWLEKPSLPELRLERVAVQPHTAGSANGAGSGDGYRVIGSLRQDDGPRRKIAITVETANGEVTRHVDVAGINQFVIETTDRPLRIVVDKYGQAAKLNGSPYTPQSFHAERERTLIVYGTRDEEVANRITAEKLQERIRTHWSNETVKVKSDQQVTDDDLRTHHLLLIGRPDTNRFVERFRDALPVAFGWRSFEVRGESYAHAGSAVVAAVANPLNARYSATVLAGLGAEATTRTLDALFRSEASRADVLVLPNGGKLKPIVTPARELVKVLGNGG